MHALKAVPKAQGKKGGGLQAYANQLGRSKQQMGEVRQAAEVASTCTDIRTSLLDKAYHLALIHKLPRSCWAGAVEALGDMAVAEVATETNKLACEFLDRAQDELSPLEIGMHVLKAVPLEKGGRGNKGGLSAYAEKMGHKKQNIAAYRQAAEVVTENRHINMTVLLDKAKHLSEIHKLPRSCWPGAVEALGNLSVAEVARPAG